MLETEHPEIFMGLLDPESFGLLLETMSNGNTDVDELTWLAWETAGVFTDDDSVEPHWAHTLQTMAGARRHLQLVSIHNDMMFNCEVYVAEPSGHLVTLITRVTIDEGMIDQVHPVLEIMVGPTSEMWTLLRRALPPLDEFRADPELPEWHTTVDESQIDYIGAAETRVHAVLSVISDPPAQPKEFVWALRDGTMYRMDTSTKRIDEVPLGELAWTLTWELVES